VAIGFLFAGALLLIAAVRGTQDDLFKQLRADLTGPNNFVFWMLAILLIGAIGYIPKLKPFSVALLALVFVAIFLRKGTGFFNQLQSAVQSTTTATAK
jgi:hypothetical protein